jgi:hypothetical protein
MMSDYVNIYECPEGCKAQGGKPIAATIRGWKKHMTHAHGQWTEDQLAAIVGASAPNAESGKAEFLAEAENTPGLASESGEKTAEGKPAQQGDGKPQKPAPEEIAYIPLRSKKLRKFFGGLIGKFVSESSVELDADDQGMIDEAFDQLEELFPIVFAVPKKQMIIESRIAAVAVPLSGLALVYIKHSLSWKWIKELFSKRDEEHPEEGQQQ